MNAPIFLILHSGKHLFLHAYHTGPFLYQEVVRGRSWVMIEVSLESMSQGHIRHEGLWKNIQAQRLPL